MGDDATDSFMETLIILSLTTLTSAFVGSFLAGYLKTKGKNLATHEDIGKLVDQVAAVTKTTKEIEAKITSGVWDRQKRWELKRGVLFEATKRVAEVDDALLSLDSVLQLQRTDHIPDDDLAWATSKSEILRRWSKASTAFDETRLFVGVVCGEEATSAFNDFRLFVLKIAAGLSKDPEIYKKSQPEFGKRLSLLQKVIRKELRIEETEAGTDVI